MGLNISAAELCSFWRLLRRMHFLAHLGLGKFVFSCRTEVSLLVIGLGLGPVSRDQPYSLVLAFFLHLQVLNLFCLFSHYISLPYSSVCLICF